MKKKKEEADNEVIFVHVASNESIRKDILEVLKSLLLFSQSYEKIKLIRHKKIEQDNKMRTIMRDINRLLNEMRQKLPQANIRLPSIKQETPAKSESFAPKRDVSEFEKLSSELRAVEEKLKRLG